MTVEEIEIEVTAKVEEAMKEFKKIVPAIKETMKQAQGSFSKIDMKEASKKVNQAVTLMKKKIQDFKKSNENNEIAIKVNNKDAQKQINQIQKQIDSLQEKINSRQLKLNVINPQIDKMVEDTRKNVTPAGVNPNSKAMDNVVNSSLASNKDFTSLNSQAQKLYTEIETYNAQLTQAKEKMSGLKQETMQTATTQNKLSSFFNTFKEKLNQAKGSTNGIKSAFESIRTIAQGVTRVTQKITNNIKNMGNGMKRNITHILKYAMALFSLRGIYSILSSSASTWLSSQNSAAKQLTSNINYMKYAMGSAFAPVIQYVIGLVYQLMKAIQSVVYALFRVNIFAKASAKSYASMAGSAKKAKQETNKLADIDEIHNIEKNNDSSGASGAGTPAPNMDLSSLDSQMNAFSQKLYDFFKPLVDSWNKYGPGLIEQIKKTAGQVGGLISSVWGSFEKIIANGTVYKTLELILAIIGDIAEAFSNAWNYNGNGDAIVQNLANAFNNLLTAIDNVVKSPGFQDWLKDCSDKFRTISEKISEIDWQPLIDALVSIGQNIGTFALTILSGLVDIFKWLVEHPIVAEILLAIAIAIGVVSTALGIMSTVMAILTPISAALDIALAPLIGIILLIVAAVAAVIAIIIIVITYWDKIKETIVNVCKIIGEKVITVWNKIKETISTVVSTIKEKVSTAFNNIKNVISNVMNTVKNVISNVWNGIWNVIKGIINKVLGGIEKFVNGTIKGINILLKGIEGLANAVGSVLGFNSISLQLNEVSLPKLAKGGVLTEATAVIAGEYSGAKRNPEIVTPQNIMEDTFKKVLNGSSNNETVNFVNELKVNGKTFAREIIEDLNNEAKRLGYKPILQRG